MKIPITRIGAVGVVHDIPGYELPPEAWTGARNVRFINDAVIRSFGIEPILGDASVAPYWLIPAFTPADAFYVYGGIGTLYVTDGTTHDAIGTILGGARDSRWNGGMFGNIGIFNNGVADPQMWSPPAITTNVAGLTNWPANTKAKVIRPFGRFLVAYDISEGAVNYPWRVKWGSSAPQGAVPATWDETDPTQDAREWDLAETYGKIIDAKPLGEVNFVYKEDETHSMTWIGGVNVFRFRRAFPFGLLAQDCVIEFQKKHFVGSYDDIYVHDGFTYQGILKDKLREWYAGRMSNPQRSYMAIAGNEAILAFCEVGSEEPSIAIFINLESLACSVKDLPSIPFVTSASADPTDVITTFDSVDITFDAMVGTFGLRSFTQGKTRFVGVWPGATNRLIMLEQGFDNNGVDFTAYLERTGLCVSGVDRHNNPKIDPTIVKKVDRVWPKARLQNGLGFRIRVGAADTPDGAITWSTYQTFNPAIAPYVEFVDQDVIGPYLAIRFESSDDTLWKLDSYDLEIQDLGKVTV